MSVQLQGQKMWIEILTHDAVGPSAELVDIRFMDRQATNDEVVGGVLRMAALVDIEKDHGWARSGP